MAPKKQKEFEVECIINHKFVNKKIMFEVKWYGFDESENTWQTEDELKNCKVLMDAYKVTNKIELKTPKRTKEIQPKTPRSGQTSKAVTTPQSFKKLPTMSARKSAKREASSSPRAARPSKSLKRHQHVVKEDYEVEAIVDDEMRNGKHFYEVVWKGYPDGNTWQSESDLKNAKKILDAYKKKKGIEAKYPKPSTSSPSARMTTGDRRTSSRVKQPNLPHSPDRDILVSPRRSVTPRKSSSPSKTNPSPSKVAKTGGQRATKIHNISKSGGEVNVDATFTESNCDDEDVIHVRTIKSLSTVLQNRETARLIIDYFVEKME